LRLLTKRLAYELVHPSRAKLTEDDVVLVFSANTLLYPALVQAALAVPLCVTVSVTLTRLRCASQIWIHQTSQLANPTYQVDELVCHIQDSSVSVIVVGKSVFEVAKKTTHQIWYSQPQYLHHGRRGPRAP